MKMSKYSRSIPAVYIHLVAFFDIKNQQRVNFRNENDNNYDVEHFVTKFEGTKK